MSPVGADAPLRVLVVSRCATAFGVSPGGADVLARRHALILARQGVIVSYVAVEPLDSPNLRTVEVRPFRILPSRGSAGFGSSLVYLINEGCHVVQGALAGAKVVRHEPVDIAISNSSLSTILLRMLAPRSPIIHYVHDGIYSRIATSEVRRSLVRFIINNVLEKIAIRLADRVICASDAIASQAVGLGISEKKLTIMYPLLPDHGGGLGTPPDPLEGTPYESRYAPYILSVGQQTGRKRFDLLIRALPYLPAEWKLVLVGDGPLQETYRDLVQAENVESRVVFLTDVGNAQLAQLYRCAGAFVLASENEGFPITLAEALSHGCPVVLACPSTVHLRPMLPAEHAVVISELSPEAIGRGIERMLADQALTPEEIRASIRRWAATRFPSEDQVSLEYLGIFRSLSLLRKAT